MDKIMIRFTGDFEDLLPGAGCVREKLGVDISDCGKEIFVKKAEFLSVYPENGRFVITYSEKSEFFRGLAICVHFLRNPEKVKEIKQHRQFKTCGAMIDVSRGVVNSVETIKDFIEYMALMGLNMLMLYTEDTYELKGHKWFGYLKGGYSEDDIRAIDKYALQFGIELIPCIQTLSHLKTALRWREGKKYATTAQTLYVGKDETYQLIEEMLATVSRCYTTKRVHIGLDEATDISHGKILKDRGYINSTELMSEHINRVCEICEKYSIKPMIWSDMFFKTGHLGGDYDTTSYIPEDLPRKLPQNLEMVYWDYCYEEPKRAEELLNLHKEKIQRKTAFAGGIWTWSRIFPSYSKTFDTARGQLEACKKFGVDTVFVTTWNSPCAPWDTYAVLPGFQMWAEQLYNEKVTDECLSEMFEICTGNRLCDFLALDIDNFSAEDKKKYMEPGCFCINSSIQHFLSDVLYGIYEKTLEGYDFKSHYKKCLDRQNAISDMGKFNDMLHQAKILTELLYEKCDIGKRLRSAYPDKAALRPCVETLEKISALYKEYRQISYKIWFKNNNPFGWEHCDFLLGGMESRINTAINRVKDYIEGRADSIPELLTEIDYLSGNTYPLTESGVMTSICFPGYGI